MVASWTTSVISKLWDFDGSLSELDFLLRQCLIETKRSQEEFKKLADDLLNAATMPSIPDQKLLNCLKILVHSKSINWSDFLSTITLFKSLRKTTSVEALVVLLDAERGNISCCFNNQEACDQLVLASFKLLKWLSNILNDYMNEEYGKTLINTILDTTLRYMRDPFFFQIIKIAVPDHEDEYQSSVTKVIEELAESFIDEYPNLMELQTLVESISQPITYKTEDLILSLCKKQNRSGIKSLTAVFMAQRTLTPVVEVAETLINFAAIFEYNKEELLSDFFQATILVMLDHQNTRYDLKALGLHFFFSKTPKIIQHLVKVEFITSEVLCETLRSLISRFKQELDELDAIFKESSILRLLEALKVLSDEQSSELKDLRYSQIKANVELNHHLLSNPGDIKPLNTILKGSVMRASVEKIWEFKDKLDMMIPRFCGSYGILLDSIIGSYSADGSVTDFSRRLASFCREAEVEMISAERSQLFDGYFICLMRLAVFYPFLTLESIVSGIDNSSPDNQNGIFYRWSSDFILHIMPNASEVQDSPTRKHFSGVTDDMKREYRDRILRLQEGEIFWNDQTQSCRDVIELVPVIGSVWLDYFKDRRSEPEFLKNSFKNVVFCFQRVTSAVICLSQWLENQENNDIRRAMASSIIFGIDEQIRSIPKETSERSIWPVVRNICNYYLSDICNPSLPHPLSITLKSIAIRSFPNCSRLQVPDPNILKDCWLYAQRQNWFNHKTLTLINRCNQAEDHRTWIRFFINYLMRLMAQDVMAKAIEFICAILLLDPISSILIILELLFEYLLQIEKRSVSEKDETNNKLKKSKGRDVTDGPGIQHEAPHVLPLVKLTVQVMYIGIWLVDFKKGFNMEDSEQPESKRFKAEQSSDESQLDLILPTIRKCIQHMNKEVKQGVFTPAVSAVMHIVKNIASTPPNRCKDILLTLIPPDLVFRMGLADPSSVPYEMFDTFCDPKNTDHIKKRVRYLCMLRSMGAL